MTSTESIVLCEGYHDRAFWAGLLLFLGCSDPGMNPAFEGRIPVKDLNGKPVTQGQYYYITPNNNRVRVVPCHGKDKIPNTLRSSLDQRSLRPFARLVVNVDADANADGTANDTSPLKPIAIENLVRAADTNFMKVSDHVFKIDSGTAEVALLCWETDDPPSPGLPNQQTLERLVCASICAAYPERNRNVADWLRSRHDPPSEDVKEHAYSFMAGWFARHGCDDFYRCLWDEDEKAIREQIIQRLTRSGAWAIAQSLVI